MEFMRITSEEALKYYPGKEVGQIVFESDTSKCETLINCGLAKRLEDEEIPYDKIDKVLNPKRRIYRRRRRKIMVPRRRRSYRTK